MLKISSGKALTLRSEFRLKSGITRRGYERSFRRCHSTVRTRYAPSPTGLMHLGGLRTALFNYLYAKRHGGQFLLRIEDTDRTRYKPEALDSIVEALKWIDIDFDEGPGVGGEFGPYFQSERTERLQ
eukprot:TRINITY_DN3052_c0_g1_i1.p1 TRINITY_DN3052_c0_g1~~TRINITY_DN3052_c0_g1_i1.p1  ORF type:complete len:127 (+),score=14.84 TRINITY_DN3052_c0_g1_i1:3-383(+)